MAEAHEKKEACLFTRVFHFPPGPSGERGRGFQMAGIVDVEKGPKSRVAYGSGINVWVREVEDHQNGFYYRGHHSTVRCARWHPVATNDQGGGYIMTGDDEGNWRVWTCREDEPVTKGNATDGYGFKCAKQIMDLSWQGDGKKVCVVGNGSEEMGKCAMWDSGNQFGIFKEAGVTLLTVDTTIGRPYRCLTGGEAGNIYCYHSVGGKMEIHGSPQRMTKKYVTCIRYHKDGEYAIAVSNESNKIFVIDGRTGKTLHKVKYNNKGSLYSISWNPDGTHFAVSGANKKIGVFRCDFKYEVKKEKKGRKTITTIEFGDLDCECVAEYVVGKDIDDQQNSCIWASAERIVASSIFGDLTVVNPKAELIKIVSGHDTNIDDMVIHPGKDGSIYTISQHRVIVFNMAENTARRYRGNHGVVGRAQPAPYRNIGLSAKGDFLITVAMNDTLARTPVKNERISSEPVPTGGAARWLLTGNQNNDLTILLGAKEGIISFMGTERKSVIAVDYESRAADIYPDDSMIVVSATQGTGNHPKVFFVKYSVAADGTLAEVERTEPNELIDGGIKTLKLCPQDNNEACIVFGNETQCYVINLTSQKFLSNGSINAVGSGCLTDVAWRPGCKTTLVSAGGSSTMAIMRKHTIFDPVVGSRKNMDHAHYGGITKIGWLTDEIIVAADDIGAVSLWSSCNPLGAEP